VKIVITTACRSTRAPHSWLMLVVRCKLLKVELWEKIRSKLKKGEWRSAFQEFIRRYSGLLQNGAQRPFRHLPGMVGNRRVTTCRLTLPDFMTAGSLPVKREPERFQAPYDLTVAETGQPSHQEPTTSGKSKESASSGSETAC
jgi:hypothetical protein